MFENYSKSLIWQHLLLLNCFPIGFDIQLIFVKLDGLKKIRFDYQLSTYAFLIIFSRCCVTDKNAENSRLIRCDFLNLDYLYSLLVLLCKYKWSRGECTQIVQCRSFCKFHQIFPPLLMASLVAHTVPKVTFLVHLWIKFWIFKMENPPNTLF